MSSVSDPVRKRQVFYIPGYDPFHPRRYRELYRKESAVQAALSGYEITLSPSAAGARYGWHVAARIEDLPVTADFRVLVWSDIVKDSMAQGILATYLQLIRTAWIYIASGALFRLMRLRKGPVIAALYPVGFLLVQLGLALLLALGVWYGFALGWSEILRQTGGLSAPGSSVRAYAGLPLGLAASYLLLQWFRAKDNKLFAYYLMHDYAYSAASRGANPPELEARLAAFVDEVAAALSGDADEVLVVGHSSGAHLGVSLLADLIRQGRRPENGPALSFLTLGQVVPMVSFLRDAWRLRADLAYLSARDDLTWIDVTAPGDGCAFALCDPVAVSGVAPAGQRWPLVMSCAFTRTLSPARWRALRWRFFRLHFQYLCAFDRPGDYDYFQITAGPRTLGARYAGRPPSPSRITCATSGYRSLRA